MKAKIKSSAAVTLYVTGLLRAFQSVKYGRNDAGDVVILMYHRVVDDLRNELTHMQPGMMVSRDTFEAQLQMLSGEYRVVPLSELVDSLLNGEKPKARTVAITFDDGWLDNYTCAYPLLKKYGVPATIFLTTDYIGGRGTFWFHKIGLALSTRRLTDHEVRAVINAQCGLREEQVPEFVNGTISNSDGVIAADRLLESLKMLSGATLERIGDVLLDRLLERPSHADERWLLNWDEVRAMAGDLIEFGSHGCSHQIATILKPPEWEQELRNSRQIIAERAGKHVDLLAYPNGNFNEDVADRAKKAGYKAAVTTAYTVSGTAIDPMFALRRVGVHEGMSVDSRGRFSKPLFAFGISGWKDKLRGNL